MQARRRVMMELRYSGVHARCEPGRFQREFANRHTTIEVPARLLDAAMKLTRTHALRGYDAVQLAGAVEVQRARTAAGASRLTLISADDSLNNAAVAEGLLVDNPNHHP